jgi:hypothetical protein
MNPHQRLVDHLAAGVLDAQDTAHTGRCPACAALLPGDVAGASRAGLDNPTATLGRSLRHELAQRHRPWWVAAAAVGVANALFAALAVVYLEPWNWEVSASPRWRFLGAAALLTALVTLAVGWAVSPGRARLRSALLLAVLTPPAVLFASDGNAAFSHFLDGAKCLWTVLVLSILPLVCGAWLLRRVARSPRRSLAMGLACAGVGLLVLQFHCADGQRAHLALFHLLPWVALGGGAVLGSRALRTWSYAP